MKGEAAHYETIELVCTKYKISNSVRVFLQNMRDYRNRISYEGFSIKKGYIKLNAKRIEDIINTLLKLIDKKLNK